MARTSAGEPRIYAVPRRYLPFYIPAANSESDGRGDDDVVSIEVAVAESEATLGVWCAVPRGYGREELAATITESSTSARWSVILGRLDAVPAYAAYATPAISSEAREAKSSFWASSTALNGG